MLQHDMEYGVMGSHSCKLTKAIVNFHLEVRLRHFFEGKNKISQKRQILTKQILFANE